LSRAGFSKLLIPKPIKLPKNAGELSQLGILNIEGKNQPTARLQAALFEISR
jgi:hypothetical protein